MIQKPDPVFALIDCNASTRAVNVCFVLTWLRHPSSCSRIQRWLRNCPAVGVALSDSGCCRPCRGGSAGSVFDAMQVVAPISDQIISIKVFDTGPHSGGEGNRSPSSVDPERG
ncbi:hypothetical protein D3C75_771420 [compost metagenome]